MWRTMSNENVATISNITAINIGDENANNQDDQDVVDKAKDAESGFRYYVERRKQVYYSDQDKKADPQAIQIQKATL